nr:unnamed protein product [Callosobruchus chinensis]
MPYDYFCPTVKLRLSNRTCKTCGLYHASVKSLCIMHISTPLFLSLTITPIECIKCSFRPFLFLKKLCLGQCCFSK